VPSRSISSRISLGNAYSQRVAVIYDSPRFRCMVLLDWRTILNLGPHMTTNLSAERRLTNLNVPSTETAASSALPDRGCCRSIVVLSGITHNNLGDDAMLVSTVQALRVMEPRAEVAVLAEYPSYCGPVAAQIDVPILYSPYLFVQAFLAALPKGKDPALGVFQLACEILSNREAILQGKRVPWLPDECAEGLRRLLSADGVVDCGGASLGVHWKTSFYEKCLDYLLAPQPLLVSGQGIDPFDRARDRDLLLAALSRATEVTLREPVSERYLRTLGCVAPILTTGDDALTLEVSTPSRCKLLLSRAGVDPDQPFLAFQYRHYLDYEEDRFYDLFAAYVDEVIHTIGLPVVGVPMHFTTTDERDHLAEVGRRLAHVDRFHVVESHLTPADAKGIFAAAAAAFGISYHSAVFSLSSGTPFLGLYHGAHYAQKMHGLSELYDLSELAVPVDGTTYKAFAQLLLTRLERNETLRSYVLARHETLVKKVRESRQRFLEQVYLTPTVPSFESAQLEEIERQVTFEFRNTDKTGKKAFWKTIQRAHEDVGVTLHVRLHVQKREWKRAMRGMLVLVRHYPRVFVHPRIFLRAWRKLRLATRLPTACCNSQ
jgi:polysaccharide pyruvyl transferase WcaK-like protein